MPRYAEMCNWMPLCTYAMLAMHLGSARRTHSPCAPVPIPGLSSVHLMASRNTARAAYTAVDLPDAVIDILTSLRNHLQDKCEPPVYVSDRRFMKSVNLLQVAAFADGRDQVCIPPLACLRIALNTGLCSLLAQSDVRTLRIVQTVRWHEAVCLSFFTLHLLEKSQSCFSV